MGTREVARVRQELWQKIVCPREDRQRFDLIFLDLPYEAGWIERILPWLARHPLLLEPEGELIVQHSPREIPLPAYGPLQRRALKSYGGYAAFLPEAGLSGGGQAQPAHPARGITEE